MTSKGRKKRRYLFAGAVSTAVILLCVIIAFAFFTDRDSVVNTFEFGNVEIVPNEPLWEPEGPAIQHNEFPKDPAVANNGSEDAVVFARLYVPVRNFIEVNTATGKKDKEVTDEIFYMKLNDMGEDVHETKFRDTDNGGNWVLLDKTSDEKDGDYREYLFGYQKILPVSEAHIDNVLSPDPTVWEKMSKTEPLFDKVQLKNYVEGTLLGDYDIKIDFYGIQAQSVKNSEGNRITDYMYTSDGTLDDTKVLNETVLREIYEIYTNTQIGTVSDAKDGGGEP